MATAPPIDEHSELPDIHEFGRRHVEFVLRNRHPPTPEQLAASFSIRVEDAKRLLARYHAMLAHAVKTGKSLADANAEVAKISLFKHVLEKGENLSDKQVQFLIDNGEDETVMDFLNKDIPPSEHERINKGVIKNKEYITAGLHQKFLGLGGRMSRRHSKKSRRHGKKSRKSRKCRR